LGENFWELNEANARRRRCHHERVQGVDLMLLEFSKLRWLPRGPGHMAVHQLIVPSMNRCTQPLVRTRRPCIYV